MLLCLSDSKSPLNSSGIKSTVKYLLTDVGVSSGATVSEAQIQIMPKSLLIPLRCTPMKSLKGLPNDVSPSFELCCTKRGTEDA
jgi:hypothetical protein